MKIKSLGLAIAMVLGLALVSVVVPVNKVRVATTNALLAVGICSIILTAAMAIMSLRANSRQ